MTAPIPDFISKLTDRKKLRNVMDNAQRQGNDAAYWAAFKRKCTLEGMNCDDSLHAEFYQVLAAYEELLTDKNGRTTKASRTRQKLARHSVEKCLEDWALSTQPTQGFNLLIEKGIPELTAEYLVIKYADRFSDEAVKMATQRLNNNQAKLAG
jgi:hypothetical protein